MSINSFQEGKVTLFGKTLIVSIGNQLSDQAKDQIV